MQNKNVSLFEKENVLNTLFLVLGKEPKKETLELINQYDQIDASALFHIVLTSIQVDFEFIRHELGTLQLANITPSRNHYQNFFYNQWLSQASPFLADSILETESEGRDPFFTPLKEVLIWAGLCFFLVSTQKRCIAFKRPDETAPICEKCYFKDTCLLLRTAKRM